MSAARETGRGTRLRALESGARAVRVRYIADAGHGWYAVPRRLLEAYGVEEEISEDSYVGRTGRVVYLEHDVDIAPEDSYVGRTGRVVYLEHDVDIARFAAALEHANAVLVVRGEQLVPRRLCAIRQRRRYERAGSHAPRRP